MSKLWDVNLREADLTEAEKLTVSERPQTITAGLDFSLYRSIQKSQSSLFEADIYPIVPLAF